MAQAVLPFKPPKVIHNHKGSIFQCPLFQQLPGPLRSQCEKEGHLLDYLHLLPVEKVGIPQYYNNLTAALEEIKYPNLIYPTEGGLFVHIYSDGQDSRNYYIAVEPSFSEDVDDLLDAIEDRLLDFVDEMELADSQEKRKEALLHSIDQILEVKMDSNPIGRQIPEVFSRLTRNGRRRRLRVTSKQYGAVRYLIVREKCGIGILEPMLGDSFIEDISCSGLGHLFIEHKIFGSLKSSTTFTSFEELDRFVIRLSERVGRPVSFREPVVDATLPDGSRLNIVFGSDISRRGSNFTIRKFTTTPLSILDLVEYGTLSYEIASYLSLVIGEGLNVFVAGETASGKTALLNAVTTFIQPTHKVISIEDTPELQIPNPNWIREVVRGGSLNNQESTVSIFTLLKAALRQRPNQILIGEIRGEEGNIAFQAMQTGHASMATFHAASVEKLIQRLTGHPINVPKAYIDNLNVVVIMSAMRLPNGRQGRRVISVNEILGYDTANGIFSFLEVFRWDAEKDRFEFVGDQSSHILENMVSLRRGISPNDRHLIYAELRRRANMLGSLHQQGITNFYELYRVLSQAYFEGIFR